MILNPQPARAKSHKECGWSVSKAPMEKESAMLCAEPDCMRAVCEFNHLVGREFVIRSSPKVSVSCMEGVLVKRKDVLKAQGDWDFAIDITLNTVAAFLHKKLQRKVLPMDPKKM